MPCGFNGDSVDFDSVVVESEFCAGDWALPSPICTSTANSTAAPSNPIAGNLPSVDIVAAHFNFPGESNIEQENTSERNNNMEIDDRGTSMVTDELKHRLLAKYEDECTTKMRTEEFVEKREKNEPKSENGGCEAEDEDELFFQPPRRISMLWNSKLRWKEERKKVLKISINKLRRIEDPELFLCRSVLINNTVRRLHREIREEKMARYPDIHRPVPVTSCSLASCNNGSIPESFPRKRSANFDHKGNSVNNSLNQTVSCYSKDHCKKDNRNGVVDNGEILTIDQDPEAIIPVVKRMKTLSAASNANTPGGMCGNGSDGGNTVTNFNDNTLVTANNGSVHENQFTTFNGEMLTNDGNCPNSRQVSLLSNTSLSEPQQPCLQPLSLVSHQGNGSSLNPTTCSSIAATFTSSDRIKAKCDQSRSVDCQRDDKLSSSLSMTSDIGHMNSAVQATKERRNMVSEYEKQYSQYSCGQLSIFGELQSVVFHSLIASLES